MRRILLIALTCFCAVQDLSASETILNMYNWADYMTDEVLKQFKDETGISVQQDYFGSNEELIAKLQAGAFDYDLVVPSDYYVKILVAQKIIRPLDHSLLSNRKHLGREFQDPSYDRNNQYSVPYFWGTTGIAFDKRKVKFPVRSWKAMFDPRVKRKVNILDDMREVFGAIFRIQGSKLNTRDHSAVDRAKKFLIENKDLIRTFNSSTYREMLDAGDVWITQAFSVDIAKLAADNPNIQYVVPEEGGTLFSDNLAIPVRSKHVKEAHQFINFILRPEIAAKLAKELRAATPNADALALLPDEIKNDPAAYPSAEILKKLEFVEDVGESLSYYEAAWIDFKTH